jgi:hypothetical protein
VWLVLSLLVTVSALADEIVAARARPARARIRIFMIFLLQMIATRNQA